MTRYFMGGTRLAELERMMMDPSRSASPHKEPCGFSTNPVCSQPDKPDVPGQEDDI